MEDTLATEIVEKKKENASIHEKLLKLYRDLVQRKGKFVRNFSLWMKTRYN